MELKRVRCGGSLIGITVDSENNVYVSDYDTHHIMKYKPLSPSITDMTPSSVTTGTNPFIANLSGTCFTTGGTVNKVQLDDGSGHTYNSTTTGTVGNTSINGTTFNLSTAIPGTYSVKVSNDNGVT